MSRDEEINIALIVPYFYIELYYYFSYYGNVFVQTYEPYYHGPYLGNRLKLLSHGHLHGIGGYIAYKLGRRERFARFLSKLFNPPHRFQPVNVSVDAGLSRPENIDLVVVVELLCRFNLRMFRNAVKVYWAIDSFNDRRIFMYRTVTNIEDYDIVFAAHKKGVEALRDRAPRVELLPLALRYEWIYRPKGLKRDIDVAFVGRLSKLHSRRNKILSRVFSKLRSMGRNVYVGSAWHHSASTIYNRSRIVLNVSRARELNLRVFEVLGTGSFLLTDRGEVEEFFKPRTHLDVFSDEDVIEKVLWYLDNYDEARRIAGMGREYVLSEHTMFHRVERILEEAGFKPKRYSKYVPRLLQATGLSNVPRH